MISLSWGIIYFYPSFQFLMLISFFVGADTITGILASIKRGESFSSKRFRDAISKYVVYGLAVLIAHVINKQFLPDFPCLKIISGLIAYSELMSIDENIHDITGKSLFKYFITKLKK